MRGEISSLALSLALAFCLWLSLAGLDASSVDLVVPLELKSRPENMVFDIPKEATLKLRANAAQLRFLAERKLTLPLDVSQARAGRNVIQVSLEPLDLPRGVVVDEVIPNLIEFEALLLASKSAPVEPRVVGRPAEHFRLASVSLEPKEVLLQGTPDILARTERLETAPIAVDGLTKSAVFPIALVPPADSPELVFISPKEVQATVEIEEIRVQAVFPDIPVDILNGGQGRTSFIVKPARVSVSVSWPESRGRPVEAGEIRAQISVDGERLKAEGQASLPVAAVPPAGAAVTAIKPATAEVFYAPGRARGEGQAPK